MEKTIKIDVPKDYEIDKEKSTFERIVFKKKEDSLPKKWEDLRIISGWWVNSMGELNGVSGISTNETTRNIFPSEEEAEAMIAFAQLLQLRNRYNGEAGVKNEWFSLYAETAVGRRSIVIPLSFKTEELRRAFRDNFKDLIKKAAPLF